MRNSFKKIGLLLGALLLTIVLGSGMNNAFAGQDAGSSLINWFGAKNTASQQEISKAITEEKERLMGELKVALQGEKKKAEEELATFTETEKLKRTSALQEYAANLKANMKTDLTEEKKAIIADLDAKHKQDIEDLKKPAAPIKPTPTPEAELKQEPAPEPEAEVKLDPTLEPELGTQTVLPSESDTETEPELASEPELAKPTSE